MLFIKTFPCHMHHWNDTSKWEFVAFCVVSKSMGEEGEKVGSSACKICNFISTFNCQYTRHGDSNIILIHASHMLYFTAFYADTTMHMI